MGQARLKAQLAAAMVAHLQTEKPPRVPEAGRLMWNWFIDLSGTRSHGPSGQNPITHAEILAYAQLHRWPLEPHHVELVRALDRAWLDHAYSGRKPIGDHTPTLPRSSGQSVNPAAFDAVFG